MAERKLRVDKLYKLAKIVVILLTIFFIFKFMFDWNIMNNPSPDQKIVDAYANCNAYPQGAEGSNCMLKVRQQSIDQSADENSRPIKDFFIAVALPLFFFGGTWLYKYLFPVKENK